MLFRSINQDIISSPPVSISPNDTVTILFYTIVDEDILTEERKIAQANFYLTTEGADPDDEIQKPVLVNSANSWDGRVINLKYFVERDIEFSSAYAKNILQRNKIELDSTETALKPFTETKILFDHFTTGLSYVADPRATFEYVQFPSETLKLKGGDCDDLSVAFSSLLESIGIQTAFVDYKSGDAVSHVNLLINTGLTPDEINLITINDKKIFVRKNADGIEQVWIPLETTSLTDFEDAWSIGADKFQKEAVEQLGLAKGTVEIVDIY